MKLFTKIIILFFCILRAVNVESANKLVIAGGESFPLIHSGTGNKSINIRIELDSLVNKACLEISILDIESGKCIASAKKS